MRLNILILALLLTSCTKALLSGYTKVYRVCQDKKSYKCMEMINTTSTRHFCTKKYFIPCNVEGEITIIRETGDRELNLKYQQQ